VNKILTYGLDRGVFTAGSGFQIMVTSTIYPNTLSSQTRAALDGVLTTTAAGVSHEYIGFKRSSAFWNRHPPTHTPAGGDTTTPFQVSGRNPRFFDAAMYDSIMLAAVAIDACLKDGCRPVGHGYEEVMPYFRAASIDGVAGPTSIKAGSNDPTGRLFSVKVGTDPASRGGGSGDFVFNEVAVTSRLLTDLQVCMDPQLGESCSYRTASPETVKCFASSINSIDVEWEIVHEGDSGLLSGYRVTAFALGEQVVATVNHSETRVTLTLEAANAALRVKPNLVRAPPAYPPARAPLITIIIIPLACHAYPYIQLHSLITVHCDTHCMLAPPHSCVRHSCHHCHRSCHRCTVSRWRHSMTTRPLNPRLPCVKFHETDCRASPLSPLHLP
jgi:hypothetical protein